MANQLSLLDELFDGPVEPLAGPLELLARLPDPELEPEVEIERTVAPINGENGQPMLFDLEEPWRAEWHGMPEFIQEDLEPQFQVLISFESYEDLLAFGRLIDQPITPNKRGIWYPEAEIGRLADKRYAYEPPLSVIHTV